MLPETLDIGRKLKIIENIRKAHYFPIHNAESHCPGFHLMSPSLFSHQSSAKSVRSPGPGREDQKIKAVFIEFHGFISLLVGELDYVEIIYKEFLQKYYESQN